MIFINWSFSSASFVSSYLIILHLFTILVLELTLSKHPISFPINLIFIEIIKKEGKNTIAGYIYNHPKLSVNGFSDQSSSPMPEKISFENKEVYLIGDFNINLLNYESSPELLTF